MSDQAPQWMIFWFGEPSISGSCWLSNRLSSWFLVIFCLSMFIIYILDLLLSREIVYHQLSRCLGIRLNRYYRVLHCQNMIIIYIYYIYTYLETPLATIFAGGQMLWMLWILRRKLVKSPDFCKNAGEIQKCRICRCINVLKQQNTEEKKHWKLCWNYG